MRYRRGFQPAPAVATAVVIGLLGVVVAVPLIALVRVTVEGGNDIRSTLAAPGVIAAIRNSLVLAVVVTVVAVPVGAAVALALNRTDIPFRGALRIGILLPLLIPQFVLGYSWTQAYARGGFTDHLIGLSWPLVLGPVGMSLILIVDAVPVVVLLVTAGLATRAEPDLERAGRVSGATGWTAMRTITVPLLRPSLAAAAVLTFVVTLESFAVPQVMGASSGFGTITTRIYQDLALGSDAHSFTEAITLALLLVVLVGVVVGPADALLGQRLRVPRAAQPPGAVTVTAPSAGSQMVAIVIAGYLLLATIVPLVSLGAAAITRGIGLAPTPGNWTLANVRAALTGPVGAALSHSLQLATVAATVLVLLGGLLAGLERSRRGRLAGAAVTLTLVLPGSALAVGVLIGYGRWFGDTLTIILLCYLAKFWALAHRPIAGALDRVPSPEVQAARISGARRLTAIRTAIVRPLLPALFGAWLLVFTAGLHEVTMSSLLYGPRSETLAVVVLNSQELGQVGPTAALSIMLTVLLLIPAVAFLLITRRGRAASGHRVSTANRPMEVAHGD